MTWNVYLSGDVRSDWRAQIIRGANVKGLDVNFTAPISDHDDGGMYSGNMSGGGTAAFLYDREGSDLNAIRTSVLINKADVVVIYFGSGEPQWNAAFDAGYAAALNKPIITLHGEEYDHTLTEVDAAANATVRTPEEAVEILSYLMS